MIERLIVAVFLAVWTLLLVAMIASGGDICPEGEDLKVVSMTRFGGVQGCR